MSYLSTEHGAPFKSGGYVWSQKLGVDCSDLSFGTSERSLIYYIHFKRPFNFSKLRNLFEPVSDS